MDARWTEQFEDFGDDPYLPFSQEKLCWVRSATNATTDERLEFFKRTVGSTVPRVPGVYGMIDATGRLLYVGKSKALRNRLYSYFLPNNEEEKSGRIVQSAHAIVWEQQPSEFAALLREQCLIRRWQPRMNVVGMPKRQQQAYLSLGRPPAESLYLSRYHDNSARCSHGPLSGIANLNRAVEILARHFKLRDCSQKTAMHLSEQLSLFDLEQRAGCVRHELGNCIAPCISSCSKSLYAEQTLKAERFLQGGDHSLEEKLAEMMAEASRNLHFEHAARLREDLRIIRWLVRRLTQFNRARDSESTIYCVPSDNERTIWYLLRHGGIVTAMAAPNTQIEWKQTLKRVRDCTQPSPPIGLGLLDPEDTLGLVTAWLEKQKKVTRTKDTNPANIDAKCWTILAADLPTTWSTAKPWLADRTRFAESA